MLFPRLDLAFSACHRAHRLPPADVAVRIAYSVCAMRTPTEAPRVAVKTDVNVELAKAVRQAAERDGRTVSGWVRHQLTQALSANEGAKQ